MVLLRTLLIALLIALAIHVKQCICFCQLQMYAINLLLSITVRNIYLI